MIVTRFPPSPTGFLHIGGLRTALYNYLFARKNSGRFILRIEDTDQKRLVEGAVQNLISTLKWAGLDYDEGPEKGGPHGPYIQSERLAMYRKFSEELLEKGAAYRCFCSAERLEKMRASQIEKKLPPKYDRACLKLSKSETETLMAAHGPFVLRQKIPDQRAQSANARTEGGSPEIKGDRATDELYNKKEVKWKDLVRGDVVFTYENLDDQVLLKSDGFPTYHLANVVDDHDMEVTHVIRGEEWLSSTPKHILLYEAFGWKTPEFAHLPLILNKDRTKLSKRQGHVAVEEYIAEGFLPEAVINFVALLGWHPGAETSDGKTLKRGETENELFALGELMEKFSLERVHKSGAVFDLEKLNWMNWQWRRRKFLASLPPDSSTDSSTGFPANPAARPNPAVHEQFMNAKAEKLLELVTAHLPAEWLSDKSFLLRALLTVEEKILQDPKKIQENIGFYFKKKLEIPPALLLSEKMKVDAAMAQKALRESLGVLKDFSDFDSQEKIKNLLLELVKKMGVKNGQILWPLRVALTGEAFSPGVFEVLWVLGKEKSLERIQAAITVSLRGV